ncbi:MAG: hypothetical protein KatS3mg102_2930 [Planctomycetota bacterium]|nr:MAG: hypothetical protein KatS3mg102_2930 [Planctomycetota bacterium]
MGQGSRIVSLSMDAALLERLDAWVRARGLGSRSRGVRQLVRDRLGVQQGPAGAEPAVATVTYVYDHHRRELMERLAHLQHQHLEEVVASTHVHLDHHRCLEVLVLRGPARRLRALAERLLATPGLERGELTLVPVAPPGASPQPETTEHARRGPAWHRRAHAREQERGAPGGGGARRKGRGGPRRRS